MVYNTTGLNDCPPVTWQSLDPRELAKDFGVAAVNLNGPRFWTLDQIAARATGEVLSFGGLDARRVAELPIPPDLDLAGQAGGTTETSRSGGKQSGSSPPDGRCTSC